MTITKTANGTEITLKLIGRLDTVTAPQFEEEIKQLGNATSLIVDFAELEYISSAGLRTLLLAQKTMNKQGTMVVKNVNETVNEVFEITGFSDVLTIE